jgi:carbonic anhydrase
MLVNPDAKIFLDKLFTDTHAYRSTMGDSYFKRYSTRQTPIATVLTCSDSRVQMSTLYEKPENDIFVIRNIGNQLHTVAGSIEYGINYLNTPVMMVMGHSDCGAIKAACSHSKHQTLSSAISKELSQINPDPEKTLEASIIDNVHHQIDQLIITYQEKINHHKLMVLGTIYDFSNVFNKGYGSMLTVNLNGERDPNKIRTHSYFSKKPTTL